MALALAAGIALPGAAHTADLLVDPPVLEAPEVVTPVNKGWYLRGDITYDFHDMDNPHYNLPGAGGVTDFTSAELDDSFDIGVGIGYQFNDYFRADLTGEYVFSSDFRGSTSGVCPDENPGDGLPGSPCVSTDTSSWSAFKLMANAYVDLGKFHGFTPYVGAGIGGAYVMWDDLENTANCTPGAGASPCPTAASGYTVNGANSSRTDTHDGVSSWRFAWAVHAGFSYDISHNTKIDLGYTYNRIEGGEMFEWLDGSGTQGYDKGFDEHIIRAGLRYQIW